MKTEEISRFENLMESLLDEMIDQQNQKVRKIAHQFLPHLTSEDLLNPHDFPELQADPIFNYEEGLAAGLMSAQMALRARIFRYSESTPD